MARESTSSPTNVSAQTVLQQPLLRHHLTGVLRQQQEHLHEFRLEVHLALRAAHGAQRRVHAPLVQEKHLGHG